MLVVRKGEREADTTYTNSVRDAARVLLLSYHPAVLNGDGYPRPSGSSPSEDGRQTVAGVATTTDDDDDGACGWSEVVIRRQG